MDKLKYEAAKELDRAKEYKKRVIVRLEGFIEKAELSGDEVYYLDGIPVEIGVLKYILVQQKMDLDTLEKEFDEL